jgi:hypothetical protein
VTPPTAATRADARTDTDTDTKSAS